MESDVRLKQSTIVCVHGRPCDVKWGLGRGGGYILEPGITIQADVPLENILALIDAARA